MVAFETPVLSVAIDAVSQVEGEDALCTLLTLFSKCKESLQDGPRLENMCWRLWHRGRSSCSLSPDSSSSDDHGPSSCTSDDESSSDAESWGNSLQGDVARNRCPSHSSRQALPSPRSDRPPSPPPSHDSSVYGVDTSHRSSPTASFRPPDRRRPSLASRRTQSAASPGKIMAELIPDKFTLSTAKNLPLSERPYWSESTSTLDVVGIPSVITPEPQSLFPKVVIVNPTPHPTPPMTPLMSSDPTSSFAAMLKQDQLSVPPNRIPLLTLPAPAPSPSPRPVPTAPSDGVLNPPDRKFFIAQHGESPDGESPDTSTSSVVSAPRSTAAPAAPAVAAPSSITSGYSHAPSHASSGGSSVAPRARQGKNRTVRPSGGSARTAAQHARAHPRPAGAAAHRARLSRVGSGSSNLAKAGADAGRALAAVASPSGLLRAAISHPPQGTPERPAPPAAPAKRRIEIATTSSEFETTEDTDDDSWASETSGDDAEADDTREPDRLREAALEAQRQRDMFAKVDRRSYTELSLKRTQSGLSSLFHPNPQLFPENHPYRHSRSTQDIVAYSHLNRQQYAPAPLQTSKGAAAVPVAAVVTAHGAATPSNGRSKLRLKGRPQGEPEDSDSGEEDPENSIQMSSSVAVQRLSALGQPRRSSGSAAVQQPSRSPPRRSPPEPAHARPQLTTAATAPIQLGYPYNMPLPMAPSTPRTTRRSMLANELSESLRRNLLWERQVSKQRPMGVIPRRQVGVIGNGVRTLTGINGSGNANGAPLDNDGSGPTAATTVEERKRKAVARNRSWADDYHAAGW